MSGLQEIVEEDSTHSSHSKHIPSSIKKSTTSIELPPYPVLTANTVLGSRGAQWAKENWNAPLGLPAEPKTLSTERSPTWSQHVGGEKSSDSLSERGFQVVPGGVTEVSSWMRQLWRVRPLIRHLCNVPADNLHYYWANSHPRLHACNTMNEVFWIVVKNRT